MMGTEFGRSGADAPSGHSAEPEPSSTVSAVVPNAAQQEIIAALLHVSKNAMYHGERGFGSGYSMALAFGFIEEHEVKKPCKCCGQPVHDYRYSRVSLAGQAYLSLAIAMKGIAHD